LTRKHTISSGNHASHQPIDLGKIPQPDAQNPVRAMVCRRVVSKSGGSLPEPSTVVGIAMKLLG
jgi:hypothetical protein